MNPEQRRAIRLFAEGKSFFLTGPAGSGKSFCIETFQTAAIQAGKTVAITAMTGAAALIIGGKTLHSYLGLGLAEEPVSELIRRIRFNKVVSARWRNLDALIVDEVSMMSPTLFEKVEEIARATRRSASPMGGIQTIFSGDFLQLPPVVRGGDTAFCFESGKWPVVFPDVVELKDIIRQADPVFQQCLNEVRLGSCPKSVEDILRSRMGKSRAVDGIEPTRLFTRNVDTEKINAEHLERLQLPLEVYAAIDVVSFTDDSEQHDRKTKAARDRVVAKLKGFLDKAAPCAGSLKLCAGAQVMLLANKDFDAGLVNGSRGVVDRFEGGLPVVRFLNGVTAMIEFQTWTSEEEGVKVTRKQLPLKLAYAITIHKSQGLSLDLVEVDIGTSLFEAGQGYVALSRVRSLEGLFIVAFAPEKIRAHPKVLKYLRGLATGSAKAGTIEHAFAKATV